MILFSRDMLIRPTDSIIVLSFMKRLRYISRYQHSVSDKDLDEVSRISLNEHIKPDFSKLTAVEPGLQQEESRKRNQALAFLRFVAIETDATPVEIPKKESRYNNQVWRINMVTKIYW